MEAAYRKQLISGTCVSVPHQTILVRCMMCEWHHGLLYPLADFGPELSPLRIMENPKRCHLLLLDTVLSQPSIDLSKRYLSASHWHLPMRRS